MAQLSLANIINISVATAQRGVGAYNNSNLALFTHDAPMVAYPDDYRLYLTASEVLADYTTGALVGDLATAVFSQSPNILAGSGYLAVIPMSAGESLKAAITRTKDIVQYFGIITDEIQADASTLEAAALVQTLNKMEFLANNTTDAIVPTSGIVDQIRLASYDKTRMLLYLADATTANDDAAVTMAAAYAGRALSTNFSGSNTTQTMHMKDLVGILPDDDMTQTDLTAAKAAGADVYASFQGVPKVFCSGENTFFDRVYNRCWLVGALEVAGFNYLAQTSSKIPQSEAGVSGLKGAYRTVLEQALSNQYAAPGSWTSPDTFGDLDDFKRNIEERGYYIYSLPVNLQTAADRTARKAPLVQIACKEAGAIHSSDVIVYLNA